MTTVTSRPSSPVTGLGSHPPARPRAITISLNHQHVNRDQGSHEDFLPQLTARGFHKMLNETINESQQGQQCQTTVLEHHVYLGTDEGSHSNGGSKLVTGRHEDSFTTATETILGALSWNQQINQVPFGAPPGIALEVSLSASPAMEQAYLKGHSWNSDWNALLSRRPLHLAEPHKLPKANNVTELRVLRQIHGPISARALSLIMTSLPRLHTVCIQRWRDMNPGVRESEARHFKILFICIPTDRMESLCIDEDWRPEVHGEDHGKSTGRDLTKTLRDLAKTLAQCTRKMDHLRHLSVAFIVDAWDFFGDFLTHPAWGAPDRDFLRRQPDWSCLQTLSLTSAVLIEGSHWRVTKLWEAAGRAVAYMPCLHNLKLWAVGSGHACILTFCYDEEGVGRPMFVRQVTAEITWLVPTAEDMARTWDELMDNELLLNATVEIHERPLPKRTESGPYYTSPKCVVPYLKLQL